MVLALCAGVSFAVVTSTNNHNLAAQRAAATASHRRAVARASAAAQARAIAAANAKAARAEAEAKAAAKAANRPAPPAAVIVQPAPAPAGLTGCGTGTQGEEVYAGANTSCPFALNVESDYAAGGYWNQPGTAHFYSYSPVTGQTYLMTSSSVGNPVVVTGGNNTLVQFDY